MSLFDTVVSTVQQTWNYITAPRVEERADNGGGYSGGIRGTRGLDDWTPIGSGPNLAATRNRRDIVARSRDLIRNAPIARGAVLKRAGKVVGTGISYHSRIDAEALGMSDEAAEKWQKVAEREFGYIADECDITAEGNFYELQYLAFLSTMQSGDVLVSFPRVKRPGCVYETKIQLIEGDRVCNPPGKPDTSSLVAGVELDQYGATVAYHVLNCHPGEFVSDPRRWQRIQAVALTTGRRTAKLLYFRERPGQSRGLPMVAPLLEPLRKLDKFSDSTLMNAIVSSMFTVFLQTPAEGAAGLPEEGEQGADPSPNERELRMGSGTVMELPPGYEPKSFSPQNPNPNFDPFFLAYVRQMGMAIETPYEVLLGAYNSSYSASRAALLDAWTTWKRMREWIVANFNQLFLEAWMDEAVSVGRILAPGYFEDPAIRRAYLGSEWIGDAPGSIDPLKEAQAADLRIKSRLSTRAEEIAAISGGSWPTKLRQMAREENELLAAGLSQPAQPGAQNQAPSAPPKEAENPGSSEDNGDNGDPGNDEDAAE